VLPLHASAAGRAAGLSGVTLWGGGDYHGLSGKGDAIDWDGSLFSARLGADARLHPNLLAGVAVSWSEADLDYDYGATFGTGAEVGGSMRYTDAANGLTIESHGRVLLGHGGDYEDWGIGRSVPLDVGQDGHGLSFSLQPTWGATASRVAQVWAQEAATTVSESAASRSRDGRVDVNLGYGLGWAEALVTPNSQLTLTNSQTRACRLGSRVRLSNRLLLNLEGTRQETAAQPVDHGILIRIGMGF